MRLVRGDVAVMALSGDYGKPRSVVVLQSDLFHSVPSVVVVPLTTDLRPEATLFRIRLEPSATNGLKAPSDIMIDKLAAVLRTRGGEKIGQLRADEMAALSAAVVLFLGF